MAIIIQTKIIQLYEPKFYIFVAEKNTEFQKYSQDHKHFGH